MNDEHKSEIDAAEKLVADAIGAAEDVPDPLDGLVEKLAANPGAAFTPEVLAGLAALKKDGFAAFEALRAQLKHAGCRVTALDEAIAKESGDVVGFGRKQADILIESRADSRTVPYARWRWLRRSRHQRPPRNLANPPQGLPPLVGAALLRDDAGGAEFGGSYNLRST